MKNSWLRIPVAGGALLLLAGMLQVAQAAPVRAALSGEVTSTSAGPMEGVIVNATRTGSTITISVVSNRAGHYSFPVSEVGPGRYHLQIRAIGYALAAPSEVMVQ
ncbi:MAG TPA: carboxypeptidase-like regulatory domain-containing protein, partial [Steroidobacteraceae bacterium]|nr:carboxypeptidase-like regulatory domain-containing protein [Steroidobacteraceae bacterium]